MNQSAFGDRGEGGGEEGEEEDPSEEAGDGCTHTPHVGEGVCRHGNAP